MSVYFTHTGVLVDFRTSEIERDVNDLAGVLRPRRVFVIGVRRQKHCHGQHAEHLPMPMRGDGERAGVSVCDIAE